MVPARYYIRAASGTISSWCLGVSCLRHLANTPSVRSFAKIDFTVNLRLYPWLGELHFVFHRGCTLHDARYNQQARSCLRPAAIDRERSFLAFFPSLPDAVWMIAVSLCCTANRANSDRQNDLASKVCGPGLQTREVPRSQRRCRLPCAPANVARAYLEHPPSICPGGEQIRLVKEGPR